MKKRILVIYARYGSGHKSIAEYVAKYIEEHNQSMEVLLLDMTDYGNLMGKIGIKLMDFVCRHRSETIFDTCYELMDHKLSTLGHNMVAKKSYDNKRLRDIIAKFNPDVTISSHFYGSNIITYYNKIGLIKSKIYTIITDYRTHECWTKNHKLENGYIVGNEMVKEELVKRGIDHKKVYAFGLPLNIQQIAKLDNNSEILKRYNLKGDKKIYLFFGGSSMGSMYYYDYFKMIIKLNTNADIIFICGKNVKLKRKCEQYINKKNVRNVLVLGYSTDVLNLMKISDLVISKPGGATVTECLEMKVPMLLVPGLGGQEKYNARFMAKKGYGFRVKNIRQFKRLIKHLEIDSSDIASLQKNMQKLDQNKAVEKINNLIKRS